MLARVDHRVPLPWSTPLDVVSASAADRDARARMPAADRPPSPESLADPHRAGAAHPLWKELERLRARAGQQEHSLATMADAIPLLRSDSQALRAENREPRVELTVTPP